MGWQHGHVIGSRGVLLQARAFNWSSALDWVREDVDNWEPVINGDLEIPDDWVVTLDTVTPVLRVLTIRGKLRFQLQPLLAIELHAHVVDIRGGVLEIGNSSAQFMGPMVRIAPWCHQTCHTHARHYR